MIRKPLVDVVARRRALAFGVGAAVVSGGYGYLTFARPSLPGGASALTVRDAHGAAARGELLLIDIRRPDEWERTGIAQHAVALDMRRADFTAALDRLRANQPGRPIALICARGVRSARMIATLSRAGHSGLVDVPEGMLGSSAGPGWLRAQLPVVRP